MRMLSALDASFIYLESDHSPMHIGGVYLIDASGCPESFNYAGFCSHVERRLRCSKVFRERLVEAPFGLAHPCWVNDPDFELRHHLPRLRLPSPGGMKELMQLCAQIFGRTLDRRRPLWEMSFVEGLDAVAGVKKGSYAIITRIHHAAIDGASGVELMGALLDLSDSPRNETGPDDWQPEPMPGIARMLETAYTKLGSKPAALRKLVGEVTVGVRKIYAAGSIGKISLPPMPFAAPASILNRPVSSSRTFWGVEFRFERIRRICANCAGLTLNDVVLAVCAGGLRAYLLELEALPEPPLVSMVPISVRAEDRKGEMGNEVSAMLVGLATDIEDPVERLLRINLNTRDAKEVANVLPANKLLDYIPSEALAAVTRLYTRMRLGGRHRPFFNVIITNVPGPAEPVYLAGARVTRQFGTAPIMDGLGLTIVVLSYAGSVSLGLTSCYGVVPDPDRLGALLEDALEELEEAMAEVGAEGLQSLIDRLQERAPEEAVVVKNPLERLALASAELDSAIEGLRKKSDS